jgi:Spy/CpxP family protein refolding chaperone
MNNNSNKRWLAIAIALLLVANVVTLILLWSKSGKGKEDNPPQGPVFEYVVKELQLDQQQQDAYAKLRTEHQQGQRMISDSMRKVKDAFFALLKDVNTPDSLVAMNARKAADMETQLELLTFKHFQKVRAICTPDQQQKFDKIIEEVLHRMARPRGGPPPPGREGQGPEGMRPPPPEEK